MKDIVKNIDQGEHVATTAILESLPISVIVVDKELNICLVNGLAQQLLGMSHVFLLRQNWAQNWNQYANARHLVVCEYAIKRRG